jgi:hypothetical protein
MPQTPLNIPIGAQISPAIIANTTTPINSGNRAVLAGYVCTDAGSAWTVEFYNGNPASGGLSLGPAITLAVGSFPALQLAAPGGLYAVTSGTTAGSVQIAYY